MDVSWPSRINPQHTSIGAPHTHCGPTVQQALFTITCTTCRVRLAVRSAEAVGAILECPKCGCMVPVTPPPGWQPPAKPQPPAADQVAPDETADDASATPADSAAPQIVQPNAVRFWHTSQFAVVASISAAAIAVVVWLIYFSRIALDNPSPARTATASSADAIAAPREHEENPQPSDQAAADTTHPTDSTRDASTPNEKSLEQSAPTPDEATSADAKPQAAPETSPPKSPKPNAPPQNTSPADARRTADSASPENQPAAESTQNQPNQETQPSAAGTARTVKLIVPEVIDVQSRLSEVIPSVEFRDMPFARAVALLSSLSGLPMTIDPDDAVRLQLSLREPITVSLTGATLEEVLQAIVARPGMSFTAEDGQVLITDRAEDREKSARVRYTVSDLTNNDQSAADRLAALVQEFVSPQSWRSAGGEGTIESDKAALTVTQTPAVHDQILVFCEKLRNARARPLKSNRDPKRFELTTRLQQAASSLDRRVMANFHEPAKLVEILGYLGQQAEIDILIDRQALAAAGLSDKSEISFVVDDRALAAALADLLSPLKLAYRPIDARTLQVTTQSALDARLDLEFYPVAKLLGKDLSAADLVEHVKSAAPPASWTAATPTAIYFDPPSAALIVLQSPPVHAAIQTLLDKIPAKQP